MTGLRPDEDRLVRYLLGLLPEDEAERIDELTVADDDVVWRLRAVEDDLVDGYVTGALSAEIREHFESFYLSSPLGREKVKFARSLLHVADAHAATASAARASVPVTVPKLAASRDAAPSRSSRWYEWLVPRQTPAWTLAAAAALLLLVGGTFLFQNLRLRHELQEARSTRAELDRRARDLKQQLDAQRAAHADAATAPTSAATSAARPSGPSAPSRPSGPSGRPGQPAPASPVFATVALVLLPQMRAAAPLAVTKVPSDADRVSAELRLESDDFSRYQVALRDSATDRIIWRSGVLTARTAGDTPAVSFIVPARVFEARHYVFELTGRDAAGRAEIIGSYPVLIARP